MAVTLRPMARADIAEFAHRSRDGYVAELVTAGEDATAAARSADTQMAAMFPGGEPARGHLLYWIEDDGERAGTLWIGPASADDPASSWIWDIEVDAAFRGRGVGKATMLLAEREARATGAVELGLSVFGHNPVARHLYESLGYGTVAIRMAKRLDA